MRDEPTTPRDATPLVRTQSLPPGRLGVLSMMGAASGIVPLPVVPTRVQYRIRGAIVHDVAERHCLVLTPEARRILAEPGSPDPQRAQIRGLATFVANLMLRRFGPGWVLAPALAGIETYALGHLFDRYLERARIQNSVRINADEAQVVRLLIDRSLLRIISPDLPVRRENSADDPPGEDLREAFTRLADGILLFSASVPAWLLRRLESAFDAVLLETPDLHPKP